MAYDERQQHRGVRNRGRSLHPAPKHRRPTCGAVGPESDAAAAVGSGDAADLCGVPEFGCSKGESGLTDGQLSRARGLKPLPRARAAGPPVSPRPCSCDMNPPYGRNSGSRGGRRDAQRLRPHRGLQREDGAIEVAHIGSDLGRLGGRAGGRGPALCTQQNSERALLSDINMTKSWRRPHVELVRMRARTGQAQPKGTVRALRRDGAGTSWMCACGPALENAQQRTTGGIEGAAEKN